jgi:ABC-2 type transport system permease protein
MSSPRSALAALTRIRLIEFVRQPEALFWVFGFPVIMSVVLGFAFRNRPPEPIPVGVAESPNAAPFVAALSRPGTVRPVVYPSAAEAREALRTGKIELLVEPGSEPGAEPTYRFDPTRPNARIARLEADNAIERARGRADVVHAREELVREKGSRYIDFLLPGLLGLNLMSTGLWGVGYSIVTARIHKTLKLMTATPMRKSDYLLSHIFSRFLFLILETGAILAFGVLTFGVPVKGSLVLLTALVIVGGLSFTGLGLACAARTATIEGINGLVNAVAIPMWLVSGTFFSAERFPRALHPVIAALPLTAMNDSLRSVMLEGKGLAALAGPVAVLLAWGLASFAFALKIFRWQ